MNKQIVLITIILGISIQCQQKKTIVTSETKVEHIFAENTYDFGINMQLKFYSDSTYTFTVSEDGFNYQKNEKFNGLYFLKKDTVYFKPFEFKFAYTDKAVIKNGFIEFIGTPFKIEIKRSILKSPAGLKFTNFEQYAVFSFNSKIYRPEAYTYDSISVKPYDLNQNDLEQIDKILKSCFLENSKKLKRFDEYVFQLIAVRNSKQEKEIWVKGFCKNDYQSNEFKYSVKRMHDGGNCNISLKINLTQNNCTQLNIAGEA